MVSEPIKTHIIRIGNSQGVRLPNALLALSGIERAVEIVAREGAIEIQPARKVRDGWEDRFQEMTALGDDAFLDTETPIDWGDEEWEWK